MQCGETDTSVGRACNAGFQRLQGACVPCEGGAEFRPAEDIPEGNASSVCRPCQSCSDGQTYEVSPCQPSRDRVCASCTGTCKAGQYVARLCNRTSDTACAACVVNCAAGQYHKTTQTCPGGSGMVDVVLANCDACLKVDACEPGRTFLSGDCAGTETQSNWCQGCSRRTCPDGYYAGGCGGYSDTQCLAHPTCPAAQFLQGASETVAGTCVPCRSCSASGLVQVRPCGRDTDAFCGGQMCHATRGCGTTPQKLAVHCDMLERMDGQGTCGVCPVSYARCA